MSVTSFLTHTRRKKLKFSGTALSFALKVQVSTLGELWRELRMRCAFDRCESPDAGRAGPITAAAVERLVCDGSW